MCDCPICCPACRDEANPGWIELDNNGPVVPCWKCNPDGTYAQQDL